MLIGITGKIGSGKTTLANFLKERFDFVEYSFAKPLKEIAILFGFTEKQVYGTQQDKLEIHPFWGISSREFLQKVGTELFRNQLKKIIPDMNITSTVWIDIFKFWYNNNKDKNIVISDVRFLDEAECIKELGGIIIKTERKTETYSTEYSQELHASEKELESIQSDVTLADTIEKNREIIVKYLQYV